MTTEFGIAPGRDQSLVEPLAALAHLGRRAHRVPAIDVRRNQSQHLRAVRGEGERRTRLLDRRRPEVAPVQLVMLSREAADLVPQQEIEHLHRLAEPVDPLGIVRVLDPEHRVLELDPAGAEPDLEPAVADVVDGRRLLGEQRRVAEGVATDQHADPGPTRDHRQRREQRP